MIDGVTYIENFYPNTTHLFSDLLENVVWDERMKARKTASFGVAYNYSQIGYPDQVMPSDIKLLCTSIQAQIGFELNNCLINFYENGQSKMGYHSDQTDILEGDTGVVIVSLGDTRVLRFRRIADKEEKVDYTLPSGSLIYMNQEVQGLWQHAIPKRGSELGRMSLTFRRIANPNTCPPMAG